jgi:SPP1 gp7 family putative phage head morphogenesis protein
VAWSVTADTERFDEASEWFGKRVVMTRSDARKLDDDRKADAFWVGAGLQLSQVQRVFDRLNTALDRGDTFEDFRKAVLEDLANPVHVETVFRNATQRAYNAGRWFQMQDPEVRQFRPFGLVDAVLDDRTTPYCEKVNGTLLALDDPWWLSHWFPAHHRCRTSVRNITPREAERRGLKPPPDGQDPASGWGKAPTVEPQWKPDRATHDPVLIRTTDAKSVTGTKTRKKRSKKEHTAKHWLPSYEPTYGAAAKSLAHGKASYERGLDMTVERARELLKPIDAPGVRMMLEALEDADAARTLRESAGETDPLRKAAAALAGHLDTITPRSTAWTQKHLTTAVRKRAAEFYNKVTGGKVSLPDDTWTIAQTSGRSSENGTTKRIEHDDSPGALEHEIGHAIEDLNSGLFGRALLFLRARTVGDKLKKHGINGEGWDDQFLNYYTGRNYAAKNGDVYGTEITSTAVEALFAGEVHWGSLSTLAQTDFEHLLFLLGQLSGT